MPIRSDRGRNATLRALATWPLYSPRRLLGITVLAVLCVAITIVATSGAQRAAAPAAPTSAPAWTVSPRTGTTMVSGSALVSIPVVLGDPAAVARQFAQVWVSTLDPHAWRDALAPLCTDEFRAVILPSLTPGHATSVTGTPAVHRVHSGVADMTVPLDTTVLALTLQDVTGRGDWRISDAQPKGR